MLQQRLGLASPNGNTHDRSPNVVKLPRSHSPMSGMLGHSEASHAVTLGRCVAGRQSLPITAVVPILSGEIWPTVVVGGRERCGAGGGSSQLEL